VESPLNSKQDKIESELFKLLSLPVIKLFLRRCSSATKRTVDVSFCLENKVNTQRSDLNNL